MNVPGPNEPPPRPFGAETRRPIWPLLLYSVLFAILFALLAWMAVHYPAR